jgi:hypothetical protein
LELNYSTGPELSAESISQKNQPHEAADIHATADATDIMVDKDVLYSLRVSGKAHYEGPLLRSSSSSDAFITEPFFCGPMPACECKCSCPEAAATAETLHGMSGYFSSSTSGAAHDVSAPP